MSSDVKTSTGTASCSAAVWRARDPTTTSTGDRLIACAAIVKSCVVAPCPTLTPAPPPRLGRVAERPPAPRVGPRRKAADFISALIVARRAQAAPFRGDRRAGQRRAGGVRHAAANRAALRERERRDHTEHGE